VVSHKENVWFFYENGALGHAPYARVSACKSNALQLTHAVRSGRGLRKAKCECVGKGKGGSHSQF
jgi:hypothetical protein